MKNTIGIDQQKAIALVEKLNDLLANYSIFYQNLRGFHWNISGPAFFELHAKFEELYTGANVAVDEVAERILTLDGAPIHAFSEFIKLSDIKEATDVKDAKATVKTTLSNFRILLEKEREILKMAGDADDEGTVDLMTGYIAEQEKTSWMLKAYLK